MQNRRAYGIKSASLFALKSSLQRFPLAAPIPLNSPASGRHRPCVYRDSPQKPTAGDPCARSLLGGFEAGGANLNLACLLLATLVLGGFEAGGPPEGFLTTALRNCAFARALRGPTFGPNAQKGPQSSTPGPKGIPKRTPNIQIRPKRTPKKDLARPTLQDGS